MEKQVLTQDRILQDYKDAFRSSYKPIVGFLVILICILALLILSTIRLYGSGIPFFLVILFDIMIVFFVWVCLGALISNYKNFQDIKSGQFYVVTDDLIGKQEPESYSGTPPVECLCQICGIKVLCIRQFYYCIQSHIKHPGSLCGK